MKNIITKYRALPVKHQIVIVIVVFILALFISAILRVVGDTPQNQVRSDADTPQVEQNVEKVNEDTKTSTDLANVQENKIADQKNDNVSTLTPIPTPTTTPAHTATLTPARTPIPTPSQSSQKTYSVVKVIDGDTVDVSIDGKVERLRLIGINTPETVDPRKPVECFGVEASNKAKTLLTGKKVILESDSSQGDRDKYDRLLRYVFLEDETNFNLLMIREGYAYEYTYNLPYKYQSEFKTAQKSAQTAQLGLWSPNTCNGNTTSSNTSTQTTSPATTQSTGKFYTSSYHSSKYYYPEACAGWKSLSVSYLKSYDSLDALLAAYPSRVKSPQCQ